jgi:Domain of unknown function DUF29
MPLQSTYDRQIIPVNLLPMVQSQYQVSLYEEDFALWIEETTVRLEAREFEQIDLESVIREFSALGRSEKRELYDRSHILLCHILKRVYINNSDSNRAWELAIREQRRHLKLLFEDSPSLRNNWQQTFDRLYEDARLEVAQDYPNPQFPEDWPFDRDLDALTLKAFWLSD